MKSCKKCAMAREAWKAQKFCRKTAARQALRCLHQSESKCDELSSATAQVQLHNVIAEGSIGCPRLRQSKGSQAQRAGCSAQQCTCGRPNPITSERVTSKQALCIE